MCSNFKSVYCLDDEIRAFGISRAAIFGFTLYALQGFPREFALQEFVERFLRILLEMPSGIPSGISSRSPMGFRQGFVQGFRRVFLKNFFRYFLKNSSRDWFCNSLEIAFMNSFIGSFSDACRKISGIASEVSSGIPLRDSNRGSQKIVKELPTNSSSNFQEIQFFLRYHSSNFEKYSNA